MIKSRVTTKSQTTIPQAVRAALGVGPGDELGYEIDGNVVKLRRVLTSRHGADGFVGNFSTFWEWDTEADRKGYDGL